MKRRHYGDERTDEEILEELVYNLNEGYAEIIDEENFRLAIFNLFESVKIND